MAHEETMDVHVSQYAASKQQQNSPYLYSRGLLGSAYREAGLGRALDRWHAMHLGPEHSMASQDRHGESLRAGPLLGLLPPHLQHLNVSIDNEEQDKTT